METLSLVLARARVVGEVGKLQGRLDRTRDIHARQRLLADYLERQAQATADLLALLLEQAPSVVLPEVSAPEIASLALERREALQEQAWRLEEEGHTPEQALARAWVLAGLGVPGEVER